MGTSLSFQLRGEESSLVYDVGNISPGAACGALAITAGTGESPVRKETDAEANSLSSSMHGTSTS